MEKSYISNSFEETKAIGKTLARELAGGTVLCLVGELGGGKTTFTQGILEELGAEKPFTSPTFVVMKEYRLNGGGREKAIQKVCHFDVYRVEASDILQLSWKELISDRRNLVIVEWAERIKEILPKKTVLVNFEWVDENQRRISIEGPASEGIC